MSRKGKPNKKAPIQYPRKCEHCGYLANNPASFSIHKFVHSTIPENQLCSLGCGNLATTVTTGKTYLCMKTYTECPQYLKDLAERTAKSWENDNERKDATRQLFITQCVESSEAKKKASLTKYKKLLAQENSSDRRRYTRQVHCLSQRTFKSNEQVLNPNKLLLGRTEHHIDHKVSKHVGFLLGIPAVYLASTHNLCVLPALDNTGKSSKCSLHPIDLLEQCGAPKDVISQVELKIAQLADLIEPLLTERRLVNGSV